MKDFVTYGLVAASLLLGACSSPMKLSSGVLDMSQKMSETEARQILTKMLTPLAKGGNPSYLGICQVAPFEKVVDFRGGADLKIDKVGVSFNALDKERKISGASIFAATVSAATTGSATVNADYEYHPFRDEHRFDNVKYIKIGEPGKLSSICFPDPGQSEVMVQEKSALGSWYAVLIPTRDKEKFMAAWLRIKPDVSFEE